jgi:hypothetical protein
MGMRIAKNVEDQHVIIDCSKIRDLLRPSDGANNSDYVTGIQRGLLVWYLEGVRVFTDLKVHLSWKTSMD